MKKVFLTVSVGLLLMSFIANEVISWSIDKAHSRLGFTINHMGISDINGEFSAFESIISTPNADFSDASIELSAEAKSINTGIGMRDDHLRSADFFDVEKFPTLTFKSTSVKKAKDNKYTVVGDLTMHGVTKSVSFTAVHNGTAKNQAGNNVAGFKMIGSIKRSDFSVGQVSPGLADEVKLIADLEVAKN